MLEDLFAGQPDELVRKYQPFIRVENVIVGHERAAVAGGLVVHGGNAPLFRPVSPAALLELLDHRLQAPAGVEYIVDQQELIVRGQARHQVVNGVHAHRLVRLIDARIRRGANRDVIGNDRMVLEHFLHGDPDGRAATPHGDEERRPESAADDEPRELHRVPQQRVGGNKEFVHGQAYSRGACCPAQDTPRLLPAAPAIPAATHLFAHCAKLELRQEGRSRLRAAP